MGTLLAVAAFAAVFAGGAYWSIQREKKRTQALHALAERLGWTLHPDPPLTVVPGPSRFELFTSGRRQHIRNHASGERDGREVAVFDYSYVTGAGKSQTTWQQTVVHVRAPGLALPAFVLRPEHVAHKIGGMFGYQDIDLENDPAFSGQYLLRGEDEAAIRALFDADVRGFYGRHARSCTEAVGADLFFWRTDRLARPEEVPALMDAALDLAARLGRRAALRSPGRAADAEPGS